MTTSAAAISKGSLASEDSNACALPWNVPTTVAGLPIRAPLDGVHRLTERDAGRAD